MKIILFFLISLMSLMAISQTMDLKERGQGGLAECQALSIQVALEQYYSLNEGSDKDLIIKLQDYSGPPTNGIDIGVSINDQVFNATSIGIGNGPGTPLEGCSRAFLQKIKE